jgi:hypothetical protein
LCAFSDAGSESIQAVTEEIKKEIFKTGLLSSLLNYRNSVNILTLKRNKKFLRSLTFKIVRELKTAHI